MSQTFSAFVMCFCLLSVYLIILLSWHFFVVWFCSVVVLSGVLYFFILLFWISWSWGFSNSVSCRFEIHCLRGDLFLISAPLGGEAYRVSLSAISISRCRAGEWPDDNIMYILGRSHLFPGHHIWPIFCQWNRITFIVIRSILEQQSIVECLFLFIFNIGNILRFLYRWDQRSRFS
jgi:hypothetical protein